MTMYHSAIAVLIAIMLAFGIAKKLKVSTELSMLIGSIVGLIIHILLPKGVDPRSPLPFNEIIRHFVEGSVTYFDVCLIFLTATFFMTLFKEVGGIAYIVRHIVKTFYKHRLVCLLLLTLIMLVPGAITGSGATAVLTVGGLVGTVLVAMGVSKDRSIALVFILAAMSAACPPINIWAMMAAAGSNMPYVGFTAPLAFLSIVGALFATFYLGRGKTELSLEETMKKLPEAPEGWTPIRVIVPFAILLALILGTRMFPDQFPVIGLPMIFTICSIVSYFIFPKKVNVIQVAETTVKNLKDLIGIMVVVGILNQILTLTGARGLLSLAVVILPIGAIFATLWHPICNLTF